MPESRKLPSSVLPLAERRVRDADGNVLSIPPSAGEPFGTSYDLYNGTPPHVSTSTSLAAAESVEFSAERMAMQVYRFVSSHVFGATCWEVEEALGFRHQTASARLRELELKNWLKKTSLRRKTSSGRSATVYTRA